jgi:hypothetical protein
MLSFPQPENALVIGGIHDQVKPPKALDGEDGALLQETDGFLDRVGTGQGVSSPFMKAHHRPAVPAGVGLGMKATVTGVLILLTTGRAHSEPIHGGVAAVIGNVQDDRVSRPTMGTIDERIPVAAVQGVLQLREAIGADAHIGRNEREALLPPRLSMISKEVPLLGGISVCSRLSI